MKTFQNVLIGFLGCVLVALAGHIFVKAPHETQTIAAKVMPAPAQAQPAQIVVPPAPVATPTVAALPPLASALPSDLFLRAKSAVTQTLRDPDSARFGRIFEGRGAIICGEVNARNGFGGYTGMTPFVYFPDTDRATITSRTTVEGLEASLAYLKNCV